MQAAIDYCRRHPHEQVSRIAAKYGVNQVTLHRRVKGTQVSRRVAHQDQQLFSSGEEGAVVELCELMADCGFPLSNNKPQHELGMQWVDRFLTRHSSVKKRYITYQERVRKQAAKDEIQKEFLRNLANLTRRKKVTPDNIWNCDEKGITMGRGGQREKAIVRAGRKEAMALSEGSREFVSVLETISAAGRIISPFIIYQGKTHRASYYLNGLITTTSELPIRKKGGVQKRGCQSF